MKKILIIFYFLFFNLEANLNVYSFDDNTKEANFKKLITELRCPKCQNNNLADSNAPLATDIKNYIYKSIKSGKSKKEITNFLKRSYGDFVTYKPSFKGATFWVWVLPFIILMLSLITLFFILKSKKSKIDTNFENLPTMQDLIDDYENNKTK